MDNDSDDEFPAEFLAALSGPQRGASDEERVVEAAEDESLCTFSDDDESDLLHPQGSSAVYESRQSALGAGGGSFDGRARSSSYSPTRGVRRASIEEQMDQIQDLLAAEEVDAKTDQLAELMADEEDFSHIDTQDGHVPPATEPTPDIAPREHASPPISVHLNVPAAVLSSEAVSYDAADDEEFSHIDVVLSPRQPVPVAVPPPDTHAHPPGYEPTSPSHLLGATRDTLNQERLKEISAATTPSQLFTSTMSRIMKAEDPNFKAEVVSRLGRHGSVSFSVSDDGQSVFSRSASMRSNASSQPKRGSFMRRGSSIQLGDDVVAIGNIYPDAASNVKRTPRRRSTVGNRPQLRDILGAPKMSKNESFQDRSQQHWSSGQLLQKRNLERQCLGVFRKYVSSAMNEEDSNMINFKCFEHFLEDMFCLPVSSTVESSKQLREISFLTANALGGEKAPKLEQSLKRLTKNKLGLAALVTEVSLGGCMLLVLIAHGLYRFEDPDLNKAIGDLRLAKLQNKIHHVSSDNDRITDCDHGADFHQSMTSFEYEHNMERLEQKRTSLKEQQEMDFKRLHTFSPQIGNPPPPPPRHVTTKVPAPARTPPPPPPPPGAPPAADIFMEQNEWSDDDDYSFSNGSTAVSESGQNEVRVQRSLSMNITPFANQSIAPNYNDIDDGYVPYSPVPFTRGPLIETSVFDRLYNKRKRPSVGPNTPSNETVDDDDVSLATADSEDLGELTFAPPPPPPSAVKSTTKAMSFAEREQAEIRTECTFKPKITPCPFVSQRSIKKILEIVNPSEAAPPVVSVIIDDVVEDARDEFRTALSDLVEPGLPVYYYNRRYPPLCAKTNTPLAMATTDVTIPMAPPLPPPDYFNVITDVNADVSAAVEGTTVHSRAHSVLKRSNSIIKGAPVVEKDPADWSGLLVELTTKIGGGLLRLNSVTEIKDIKKLAPDKKKGKKKAFKNVMEEMNDFLKRYKSMGEPESESESESEETVPADVPPVVASPISAGKKVRRTVLVPRGDMTPAGAFRQMKPAVKVGLSKIPPPPPLPGTENDYFEPPPVPARVYPNSKAHRRTSKEDRVNSVTSPSAEPGNLTDLLAVAMGRTAFGGELEGVMTGDMAKAYDDNGVLDPGYYLPAPEEVVVHRGKLVFRGITGEDVELDEEVLAHLELVGEAKRPPPLSTATFKRNSVSIVNSTRQGDVNDITGIWRGKITVNDLPTPKNYNFAVDKLRAAKGVRLEQKKREWATGMRNYGEFPEELDTSKNKNAQMPNFGGSVNGSVNSQTSLNLTKIEEFTHHADMRSAAAKEKLRIKSYRKKENPSDVDLLPLQSRLSEKAAAKTSYSQQGGKELSTAYWTGTLRDYDKPPEPRLSQYDDSDTSVCSIPSISTTLTKTIPKPPKFSNVSKVEQRRRLQLQKEEDEKAKKAVQKKKIKERLHRQAVPNRIAISPAQYQEWVADKYSNNPDVGYDVNMVTRLSSSQYQAVHGRSPPLYRSEHWSHQCNEVFASQRDETFNLDDLRSEQSSPPLSYLEGMSGFDTPRVSLADDDDSVDLHQNSQNITPDRNIIELGDEHNYGDECSGPLSFERRRPRNKLFTTPPNSRGFSRPVPTPNPSNHESRTGRHWNTSATDQNSPNPPPPPSSRPPPPPPEAAFPSHEIPPPPPPPPPRMRAGQPPPPPTPMPWRPPPPPRAAERKKWRRADDDASIGAESTESSAMYESNYFITGSSISTA